MERKEFSAEWVELEEGSVFAPKDTQKQNRGPARRKRQIPSARAPGTRRTDKPPSSAHSLQRYLGNRYVQRVVELAQRRGGGEAFTLDDETAGRINRARGSGQPLDGAVKAHMSEALGFDFSGVRVHTDSEAHTLNGLLSARAFTTGQDIFFRQGEYNAGSGGGRELIAHELSHVVQQSTGRVSGGGSGMTVRPAGDVFEQEAETLGRRATRSTFKSSLQRAVANPAMAAPADILAMQRTIGNQAVCRLLTGARQRQRASGSGGAGVIQTKPTVVGQANDEYEKEVNGDARVEQATREMVRRAMEMHNQRPGERGRGVPPAESASLPRPRGENHLSSIHRPYLQSGGGEGIPNAAVQKEPNLANESRERAARFRQEKTAVIQRVELKQVDENLEESMTNQYALRPSNRRKLYGKTTAPGPEPSKHFRPLRGIYEDYPAEYVNGDTYDKVCEDFRNECGYYAKALQGITEEELMNVSDTELSTAVVDRVTEPEVGAAYHFVPKNMALHKSQKEKAKRAFVLDPAGTGFGKIFKDYTPHHWATVVAKDGDDVITSELNAAFYGRDRKPWFTLHKGRGGFYQAFEAEYTYLTPYGTPVRPKIRKVHFNPGKSKS